MRKGSDRLNDNRQGIYRQFSERSLGILWAFTGHLSEHWLGIYQAFTWHLLGIYLALHQE